MKRILILLCIVGLLVSLGACAPMAQQGGYDQSRYNTQKGALGGAAVGAIAGQAIGRNTEGTLIGAVIGTALGALIGNAADQSHVAARERVQQPAVAYPNQQQQPPPGQWVTVPGKWVSGKWVPPHQIWMPVNP